MSAASVSTPVVLGLGAKFHGSGQFVRDLRVLRHENRIMVFYSNLRVCKKIKQGFCSKPQSVLLMPVSSKRESISLRAKPEV